MGLFSKLFGSTHDDDHGQSYEPENWQSPENKADAERIDALYEKHLSTIESMTAFERGQASARFEIDDMRKNYSQYGYASFRDAVEGAGKHTLLCYERNKKIVAQGHTEVQSRVEFERGRLSMFD